MVKKLLNGTPTGTFIYKMYPELRVWKKEQKKNKSININVPDIIAFHFMLCSFKRLGTEPAVKDFMRIQVAVHGMKINNLQASIARRIHNMLYLKSLNSN